jgi:hypothetical protein
LVICFADTIALQDDSITDDAGGYAGHTCKQLPDLIKAPGQVLLIDGDMQYVA